MSVLDPSGYQIIVMIKWDDVRFPLWVGGARQDDVSVFLDPSIEFPDIPIVESVSLEIGRGLVGSVSVEIAAPYDLGLALLESRLFTIGSVIEVQFGYPKLSRFIPWFSAMQTKPTVNLSQEEGLSATLNGEAGAFSSMRTSSSETFNDSYAGIIETIANADGNQWTVSLPDPIAGDDALYADREGVSQANMPDWYFIIHISRLANCDAFMDSDPEQPGKNRLVVLRRSESLGGEPRYTFVSRGRADFINTFPLFEFESSAEGVWLPASAGRIRSADIDPDTGTTVEAEANPELSETPRAPGESGAGEGSTDVDGTTVELQSPGRNEQASGERLSESARATATPQEVVSSRSEEGQVAAGLNAQMSSIGVPELVPGEIIAIAGAGVFNGNYAIETISHSVSADDWSMSVKLLSNSLYADDSTLGSVLLRNYRDFGQRINDQPPEESTEAGSGATSVVDAVPV